VGEVIHGLSVRHIDELSRVAVDETIAIGVIATPAGAAQAVADELVAAGVTSILNFAPCVLSVPANVDVRKVDLAIELQILSFHEHRKATLTALPGRPIRHGGGKPGGGRVVNLLSVGAVLPHRRCHSRWTAHHCGKTPSPSSAQEAGQLSRTSASRGALPPATGDIYARSGGFHGGLATSASALRGLRDPRHRAGLGHLYVALRDEAAVLQLVPACPGGLDSMVVGEAQILGS
jgi:hypothetical protein